MSASASRLGLEAATRIVTDSPRVRRYKQDIRDTVVVLVTPDAFRRDFTDRDVEGGKIASKVLAPSGAPSGSLVAAKMVNMDDRMAAAVADDLVAIDADRAALKACLVSGPSLVLVMTGESGFLADTKARIGPSTLAGGSLSARAFNPDCLKAIYAGNDDEPGLTTAPTRLATYRVICRLFEVSAELGGGGGLASLFKHDLPPEIVGFALNNRSRMAVVLKRASRNGFEVVGMKMVGGRKQGPELRVLVRRCNGRKKWAELCGDGGDVVVVAAEELDAWVKETWGDWWVGAEKCALLDGVTGDDGEESGGWRKGGGAKAAAKQEGGVDGFKGGKFDRVTVNLVETACVVMTPELVGGGGLNRAVEVLVKNGFEIVAARLVSFGKEGAREWVKIKGGPGAGGWAERVVGGVACVLAVESDNALVRLAKLVGEAERGDGGGGGGFGGRRGGSGVEGWREEDGDGKVGVVVSDSSKTAGTEICYFFSKLYGQARIQGGGGGEEAEEEAEE